MAGKIIADTIEHSSAGSVDTTYVVNGSAKAWVNFNGTGTVAIRDSLNFSSITDNDVGRYTANFSSDMSNINYEIGINGRNSTTARTIYNCGGPNQTDPTTSDFDLISVDESAAAYVDSSFMFASVFGDLA